MSIALPTGSPARIYSPTDFGRYTDTAASLAEPRLIRVDTTLNKGSNTSMLVRGDVTKLITGVPKSFAAYWILRGDLGAFTPTELQAELAYIASIGTVANVSAILQGRR